MDSFFDRAAALGYEVVGVAAPGLAGLAVVGSLIAPWLIGAEIFSASEFVSLFRVARNNPWLALVALAGVAYLVGHLLLWVSKVGLPWPKNRVWKSPVRQFLLLGGAPKSRNYMPQLKPLLEASADWLADGNESVAELAKSEWRVFYLLATKAIAHSEHHSLVDTFRNKYTLHRSLATATAIGAWLSLFNIPLWICIEGPSAYLAIFAAELVFCVLLVNAFSAAYVNFWDSLGDTAVVEAFLLRIDSKSGGVDK